MPIATTNPATGAVVRSFEPMSADDVERRVALAARAARAWRDATPGERARVVARAGELLEARRDEYASLMTLEMGKPIQAARDEATKCAAACRYYAEHAEAFLAPEPHPADRLGDAAVHFRPLGLVLAVMPWNFPFWQVIRFAAPALTAGNVALLKHASNVPQCALAIEALFRDAGAPEGVFTALLVESARVGVLIADARVAAVTLTGSEGAGADVGAAAGRHLKKTVLELGGSDPFVVLPSADVALAARTAVAARAINNGQSCIAAKRFVVHDAVYDEFAARFVEGMCALRVGDPARADTQVGPLATASIRDEVEEQVRQSVAAGARVLCGGQRGEGAGFYYLPTVLADVPPNAPAAREEVFGPVAALFRVDSADDALRVANDSPYGLGASVWTRDEGEATRFAAELEAGSVFVNAMVASDPRLPFGGVKRSGYGRELGLAGMREFQNVKTVRVARGGDAGASTE